MKLKKQGFTLIELLIVIAIIGILSTLAVVALQSARQSARDAKRISDIKQMQIALELYYNARGQYPDNVTSSIEHNGVVYMAKVPTAPNPADGDCVASNTYEYIQQDSGASYTIDFCLGGKIGELNPGSKQAVPGGILSSSGGGGTPTWTCGQSLSYQGHDYATVVIGSQCWFAENLNTSKYNNGTDIPYNHDTWATASGNPAWSWPSDGTTIFNDSYVDGPVYGKLYNWYAVNTGDLCPVGWRVPSDPDSGASDFADLVTYLGVDGQGGSGIAVGGKMKSERTHSEDHPRWDSPNESGSSALNSSGFNALPAGNRSIGGSFLNLGDRAVFWSSSEGGGFAWSRLLYSGLSEVDRLNGSQAVGFSVRCLKN